MGPIMLNVEGFELDSEDKEILEHPLAGGLILFGRNFADCEQLAALVKSARIAAKRPILIAVDHEGGRVQRFRQGFTRLPSAGALAKHLPQATALNMAKQVGWMMAAELLAMDIDISFAPVLDINAESEVIGDRGFAENRDDVAALSAMYAQGMREAGMKTTGKHFPGHGNVKADSHIALPIDSRSKQQIFSDDLFPFKTLMSKGLLDAVMPAHVVYEQLDSWPAGFSEYWIKTVLKQELGFNGVVISDDMSMHGASFAGSYLERAERALLAGCDLILACNNRDGAVSILDNLNWQSRCAASEMLKRPGQDMSYLQQTQRWRQSAKSINEFVDHLG